MRNPETSIPSNGSDDFDDSPYAERNAKRAAYEENLRKSREQQAKNDEGREVLEKLNAKTFSEEKGLTRDELGEAIKRARNGEHIADAINDIKKRKNKKP
jgi:hypothetical protein